MKKILLLFLLFGGVLCAFPVTVVHQKPLNGESTLVIFPKEQGITYSYVRFAKQKFPVFQHPLNLDEYYALIPVSYYAKAAKKPLTIYYKEGKKLKSKELFIEVLQGAYEKERIHVSGKKVNPKSPKVKKRTAKEYSAAMKLYHTVTPKSYLHRPFILPLQSKITSDFGKARIYNGSLKGYHSGTDFRAKVGTPVVAANDGRVAFVQNRFYSGGTVIIDHGEGIYTCYFHLSHFDVKKGEMIQRGEKIGLSGKSGRVTGPHLHFAARVDGVQVNPLQLIKLLNENLLKEQ